MTIDHPVPAQLPALRALWKEAFGDTDAFLDAFFRTGFSPSRCRCVTVDGRVVSALYWFDCEFSGRKTAYLYAVATAKSFRGQGLCRALLADTHALLTSAGYAGTILVPGSDALFRFYEALSYKTCAHISEFSCTAGDHPVSVRPISAGEYAEARRQLLPPDSVIQEGENLAFLQTQADFYMGADFLLAAFREGSTLYARELLGDPAAAPGILRALNCEKGCFRTPGRETPFAMFYPLLPTPAPSYFAFAFD